MKKILSLWAIPAALMLGACGDDSSSSGPENSMSEWDISSGSAESSSSVLSSSSEQISSSSIVDAASSSSTIENFDSSSSEKQNAFGNKSRDDFLNPEINYGTFKDPRDNQEYKVVKIGEQTWFAQNLNYADSVGTPSLKGKSWCYNNDEANCEVAGRLYTWAAAIDSVTQAGEGLDCGYGKTCEMPAKVQGICPTGWHLPSYKEWSTLFETVGGQSNAGKILKSATGWYSTGNGTDAYGFSALPAGGRDYNGDFSGGGYDAYFWSSSELGGSYACYMFLGYDYEAAYLYFNDWYYGFSVRCLKD